MLGFRDSAFPAQRSQGHGTCPLASKVTTAPADLKRCSLEQQARLYNFFLNLFNLFIYFWLRWFFVAARGLSLVAVSGGYSSLRCEGFSLRWLLLLWSMGSRRTGFSSCGTWAQ